MCTSQTRDSWPQLHTYLVLRHEQFRQRRGGPVATLLVLIAIQDELPLVNAHVLQPLAVLHPGRTGGVEGAAPLPPVPRRQVLAALRRCRPAAAQAVARKQTQHYQGRQTQQNGQSWSAAAVCVRRPVWSL